MSALSSFRRRLMVGAYPKELPNYLCFTALEDGEFTFKIASAISTTVISDMSYSLDGKTWVTLNNVNNQEVSITTPTILAGEKVYWRGNGRGTTDSIYRQSQFSSTCKFNVEGNILSLLYYKGFKNYNSISQYYCFARLFSGSLVVNADNLIMPLHRSHYCYQYMFEGCNQLVSAKFTLPDDNFVNSPYSYMFDGCNALVNAPVIENTIGENWDYMFRNCASLKYINDINISSGTLNHREMFRGCVLLTKTPISYASGVTVNGIGLYNCYYGCTSLVEANSLENLTFGSGDRHCNQMFYGCTSLIAQPKLPNAASLTNNCFNGMFFNCTSLTSVQSLPWTTLANQCYMNMYYGCSSLLTAPELSASVVSQSGYYQMFRASGVNYIKMLATDISASDSLTNWTWGFGTRQGIFVKHIDAQWTTTGPSGVPTNWTVIYYDPSLDKYYLDQQRSQECDDHGNPI